MANESDRLLIDSIREKDAAAWRQFIDRYEGRLRAFIRRRIKNPDVCDDLVQDTFLGFLASLPHFDDRRDVQTYLFQIASNKSIDHLRKIGRRPIQQATEDALGNDPIALWADSAPGASSVARGGERRRLEEDTIAQCLGTLLDDWLEKGEFLRVKVLEALLVRGLPNKEAAVRLGITEQQVANIRFAAVRKLTESIRRAGLSPSVFPELANEAERER